MPTNSLIVRFFSIKHHKMLSVGLESHHDNVAGVMIHRLNPWSKVYLWTRILELAGQAIHLLHESKYKNRRLVNRVHITRCFCFNIILSHTLRGGVFLRFLHFTFCITSLCPPCVLHWPSASLFGCCHPINRLNLYIMKRPSF